MNTVYGEMWMIYGSEISTCIRVLKSKVCTVQVGLW